MTERLSSLLHDEADSITVPSAPTASVLAQGRVLRRRRRAVIGVAGAALVAIVGTTVALATTGGENGSNAVEKAVDPADTSSTSGGLTGAVFTVGTTVYYDGGAKHVSIDDKAIKSSYYTSAGLLVRHGNNNASDGGGPQRFSLVRPDGTVSPVSVVTEEIVPGVDPMEPFLAYTEVKDDVVQVVVHDVSTDEEVARVSMPGGLEWGGWSGPPVALSGDIVYVGTEDVMRTVDWRTGEIGQTDVLRPGYPKVDGGRTVQAGKDGSSVVDVATGETLLVVPVQKFGYLSLSPDGRFATFDTGKGIEVYDVDAGTHISFDGTAFTYGWTPEDDLARLKDHHVVTCSATTGTCTTGTESIPAEGGGVAPDDVRYAGQTFES